MKSNEQRHTQAELVRNLERCPKFERCNRNLCPLDYELERRHGGAKCRWLQEGDAKLVKTGVATFPGLGAAMPDDLLRMAERSPNRFLRCKNASQARYSSLRDPLCILRQRIGKRKSRPTPENVGSSARHYSER